MRHTKPFLNAPQTKPISSDGSCIGLSLAAWSPLNPRNGSSTGQSAIRPISFRLLTPHRSVYTSLPSERSSRRIPLYYPIKAVFILYLVLPQTKGSSYLYMNHLKPFFHAHESQIDATLSSLKTRSYAFVQDKLRGVWGSVATSMSQPGTTNDLNEGLHDHAMNRGAPPSMHDPASGPANLMGSLLTSFGPNILLQSMAFMNSTQNAATARTDEARRQNFETPGNSRLNIHDEPEVDESVEERKRRLEAELAALSGSRLQGYQVDSTTGTDRFEEVDTPSDAEGDGRQRHHRPTQGRSGSWLSWGSSNTGYERVKSD